MAYIKRTWVKGTRRDFVRMDSVWSPSDVTNMVHRRVHRLGRGLRRWPQIQKVVIEERNLLRFMGRSCSFRGLDDHGGR
jgi:hypothetical protein